MKSLTSARGFTARAIAVSWRLFESGAVSQSTHLLTHTQVIADLILPVYAQAGDWSKGGPPVSWQVGQWCLGCGVTRNVKLRTATYQALALELTAKLRTGCPSMMKLSPGFDA